jgi:glucose/arabinose dehydrogenase
LRLKLNYYTWGFVFLFILVGFVLGGFIPGGLVWGGALLEATPALQSAEPPPTLPPNFQMRTVVSGLQYPTDMALLPSGDFLIAEKGTGLNEDGVAHVRLVRQGVLVSDPVVTLSVTVLGDSGIYSIVIDPAFASNHYFYLWYSAGKNALAWPGQSVDRLSRFTFDPATGKADALSETIILDGIRWSQWHNGGGVAFDGDGNLLIATGDAAMDPLAQDMTSLNGKLLRIRPKVEGGYSVPTDHKNVAQAMSQDGQSAIRPEIYAWGLRNPFRMTWNPQEQAFYLMDVGFNAWEEVNRVEAGANYGWAVREGPCPKDVRDPDCAAAPPEYTDPVFAYPHPESGGAGISAMAFYSGTLWPELYQGKLFYADFNWRYISMVDLAASQTALKTALPFGDEIGHLVDLEATNEGLYVLSIYDGTLRFIYYSEGGNQWPTARLSAAPLQGAAPLTVTFSAAGSSDPEQDELRYVWDFGDGSAPITSTQLLVTHVYTSDLDAEASLQVVDVHGGKSEAQRADIQVYSGAMPTIVQEIAGDNSGSGREKYRGGDEIRFSVARVGGKSGLNATSPYIWSIKQHHNQHIHFVTAEYAGDEVTLTVSDNSHAAEVTIWYEVELTMLTEQGQAVRVTRAVYPDVVALDVRSSPGGAGMLLNGVPQASNQPIPAIVGQHFTLEAPEILYHGRSKNRFARWRIAHQDAGDEEIITTRSFELFVTGEAASYVADYEYVAPAQVLFLPSVVNLANSAGQ